MSISRRFVPSLQELRALDAVVRHKSISAAARELNVSQPTISYHIKQLEEKWETKLFRSKGRGLEQTELVEDILSEVSSINQSIENLSYMLASQTAQKPLAVSIAPSLASIMLVPRLERFQEAHPNIPIRISATNRYVKFSEEKIDLALRLLPKPDDDLAPSLLLPKPNERMRVVCSPYYLRKLTGTDLAPRSANLSLLENADFIHEDEAFHWQKYLTSFWPDYTSSMTQKLIFNNADMILQSAIAGRGLAILRDLYVFDALAKGDLVEPFAPTLACQRAFQFVLPDNAMPTQAAWNFIGWLCEEIKAMDGTTG
ncbi:LysR substrate-binding domain-containing protein [Cohaesibacter gelatinilyticus]|uniref:LysR family transcriptional regulator, glycine cleavage system transcriptional activator n=1 Tax=Cohaesibacter gelatinilyticus TaxID=372072 RepID=A0A285PFE2_9HYPH|nr:LysR substrate-binding domain-containing protein [Cohaesibacter gelatinilyticus]SNZ20434.1 LysR family transcriptional regulator, glycine cleavage system transcriptional activator [Cohaesibacter gelatinilyticus]